MANEDNKGIVAGIQDKPVDEAESSQSVNGESLHDWQMIHCSSEGWDEPSLFRCSKCGALRVCGTYEAPKAEGCPVEAKQQVSDFGQIGESSEADGKTTLIEGEQSSVPMRTSTPEERLAKWDAQSALDILERYERGQLITRENADAKVQAALANVLPIDAGGRLLKPGDRAHVVGDNGITREFTVFAVGRSTVITDAGESYAAERCRHSD